MGNTVSQPYPSQEAKQPEHLHACQSLVEGGAQEYSFPDTSSLSSARAEQLCPTLTKSFRQGERDVPATGTWPTLIDRVRPKQRCDG